MTYSIQIDIEEAFCRKFLVGVVVPGVGKEHPEFRTASFVSVPRRREGRQGQREVRREILLHGQKVTEGQRCFIPAREGNRPNTLERLDVLQYAMGDMVETRHLAGDKGITIRVRAHHKYKPTRCQYAGAA